jgi:hypothetical protein
MKEFKLKMSPNDGEGSSGGAPKKEPSIEKMLDEKLGKFSQSFDQLGKRLSAIEHAAIQKQAPKQKEDNDDLDTMILSDPRKAVEKIKSQVREEVMTTVNSETSRKEMFANSFNQLQTEYPEISDTSSELHKRAKEIMAESSSNAYDPAALERAVLRAASEKGVLPVQHRKKPRESDDDSEGEGYLGGGSSGFSESRSNRRSGKSDKIPSATLAFAQLVGMDVKDPKIIERLTKTYNERKNNWSKYK